MAVAVERRPRRQRVSGAGAAVVVEHGQVGHQQRGAAVAGVDPRRHGASLHAAVERRLHQRLTPLVAITAAAAATGRKRNNSASDLRSKGRSFRSAAGQDAAV